MRRNMKKAVLIAAFGYLSVMSLSCGMLKAAQITRQTLYGGRPVMAQIAKQELPDSRTAYSVSLGGGEWQFRWSSLNREAISEKAEQLPPCMAKLLIRMILRADSAAGQTAEWISGMYDSA